MKHLNLIWGNEVDYSITNPHLSYIFQKHFFNQPMTKRIGINI